MKYGYSNSNSYLLEIAESGADDAMLNSIIFKYNNIEEINASIISINVEPDIEAISEFLDVLTGDFITFL